LYSSEIKNVSSKPPCAFHAMRNAFLITVYAFVTICTIVTQTSVSDSLENFKFTLVFDITFINTMPLQHVRRCLATEQLGRFNGMLDAVFSQHGVANALNVSQSVVNRAWNRLQTFGTVAHRHGGVC
jgi:hypothetical protein